MTLVMSDGTSQIPLENVDTEKLLEIVGLLDDKIDWCRNHLNDPSQVYILPKYENQLSYVTDILRDRNLDNLLYNE